MYSACTLSSSHIIIPVVATEKNYNPSKSTINIETALYCILARISTCLPVPINTSLDLLYLFVCFTLVSLSEEQQDSRPPSRGEVEVEDQEEEDSPLMALAPDVSLPEEQPSASTDVSACPAFQCLDEVRLLIVIIFLMNGTLEVS